MPGMPESRSSGGPCPCGAGPASYHACCGRLHRGEAAASTAVQLLRSRYAAYVVGDAGYLVATCHVATRPGSVEVDPAITWLGLDVGATTGGQLLDTTATVEFTARYRRDGRDGVLEERSRFTKDGGRWYYVAADA